MLAPVGNLGNPCIIQPIVTTPPTGTICERIQNIFLKIKDWFQNTCLGKIYLHVAPFADFINRTVYALYYLLNLYSPNLSSVSAESASGPTIIGSIVQASRMIRVVAVAAIPLALYNIYDVAKQAIHSISDRVNFILKMIVQMGWLNDCIACVISGFNAIGVLGASVLPSVNALYGIGAFFSLATVALSSKRIHENRMLLNAMDEFSTHDGPDKTLRFLVSQDDAYLQKFFKVDGCKLRDVINQIRDKVFASVQEKTAALAKTVEALRDRITTRNWMHALLIVATVIAFIGTILLLFTPLAIVAYALLAAGTITQIVKFFLERHASQQFLTRLNAQS